MKQSIAFVVLEPEPPGIDEDEWDELIDERVDLSPELAHQGVNPFTGEPMTFSADPRNATLVDASDGKALGELRWSEGVPGRLELFASPSCAEAATEAAADIARELGAIVRGPSMTRSVEELLDGVDDIDWSAIRQCASESSAFMPDALRGLFDADPERRVDANNWLQNAFHQGTLYPAGAHAFPFLLRALAERDVVERDAFAAWVAIGLQGANLRDCADAGIAPSASAALVAPHAPTAVELLTPFLRSPVPGFRDLVAEALATVPPELADAVIPHVENALEREIDDDVRSQLRHSLMFLRGQGEQVEAERRREHKEYQRRQEERLRELASATGLWDALKDLLFGRRRR